MTWIGPGRGKARAAWLPLWLAGWACGGGLCGSASEADPAIAARVIELRAELARHDDLYFRSATPEITDEAYDELKRELARWEEAHPEWVAEEATSVGDDRSGRLPVWRHRVPMLSLAKTHTEEELREYHATVVRALSRPDPILLIEPKYDGVAISLVYERGVLVRAVTRGNGQEGDDVTENVRLIRSVRAALDPSGGAMPGLVELRGEIYLGHEAFRRLNAVREAAGEEPFAHPRNVAAGTLKSEDAGEVAERGLSLVIHGWGAWEGSDEPATHRAFLAQVAAWELPVVSGGRVARTAEETWAAVRALEGERFALAQAIDGAVVKLDDVRERRRLGEDRRGPRWAVACKFAPARVTTRLRAIRWQVGRTGGLTPVAEFEPVTLGGATVSRATLHNQREIARLDLRPGDWIHVEKAGEIIPVITGVETARRLADAERYVLPTRCPSCAEELASETGAATLRCANERCGAQLKRRLVHFASAGAVGLEGFGPATIAGLVDAGLLSGPGDFYRLRRDDLIGVAGVGEKTADRLMAGIERSKGAELWRFIFGAGISHVGEARARLLAERWGDWDALAGAEEKMLAEAIGPAAAASVSAFMAEPGNQADIRAMSEAGVRPAAVRAVATGLEGKTVVFTGTLHGLTRAQAAAMVRAAGGGVRDKVTRQTDYVVAGEGAGAKLEEATKLGVPVLTGEEFKRMVGAED